MGEDQRLFDDLPPALRIEVALQLNRPILERVPFFRGASEPFLRELAQHLRPAVFIPGELVLRRDATRLGEPPVGMPPARLAFLDPPYGENLAPPALAAAAERGWLAPEAICVVETRTRETFEPPPGFARVDARTFGGTRIDFLRYDGDL